MLSSPIYKFSTNSHSTTNHTTTKVPLHGVSRTAKFSQRTAPISMTNHPRARGRPLPLVEFPTQASSSNRRTAAQNSPSTTPPRSPLASFSPSDNHIRSVDDAIKGAEERLRADLARIRISCSHAILGEQRKVEKIRAQSLTYLKERNFAWEKMKALLAEKEGSSTRVSLYRSKSLEAVSRARQHTAARLARSQSPRSSLPQIPASPSSLMTSTTSNLIEIKKEEEPLFLTSPGSVSLFSPADTLVGDDRDPWKLMYPGSSCSSQETLVDSPPSPKYKSESSSINAPLSFVELADGLRIPLSTKPTRSGPTVLKEEHLRIMYMRIHRSLICRVCCLKQSKLDKEKRSAFQVASFDIDSTHMELHDHCLSAHESETMDIAKLPPAILVQMRDGFADQEKQGHKW